MMIVKPLKHTILPILLAAMTTMILCSASLPKTIEVIPYPNEVIICEGTFNAKGATFTIDPAMGQGAKMTVKSFAENLSLVGAKKCKVKEGKSQKGFVFTLDSSLATEAYSLEITPERVLVKASTDNGFRFAIQTLRQMLPVAIFGTKPAHEADWTLQCCKVNDAPRFGYRGLHLDVSRHFFPVEEVKKYLDILEMYKMNTFHWHLTDDQGWRIEIKKYPRLTEVGSMRNGTMVGHNWGEYDGIPYGGYYTQEQIREVVTYAAERGITVIPEIDLPGHMLAAITSYPELGCTGGPYEVWQRWGVSDDVLCVGKEETFTFLENVLDEVMDLFPSTYIHIGGDECPKTRWENCPACQAKIRELGLKDDESFKAEHYLQSYVMERIEKYLNSKGRKIIGWDEILEGKLSPNATVMSWRGSQGGIAATKAGHDAIMTPNSHFYFDYCQGKDAANEPLSIGGYLPLEKVYSYEPFTQDMDETAREHILGVQANLWTEYIHTPEHLEYMLLPRAAALSEVQWTQPEGKNLQRFIGLIPRMTDIYDLMGYNYSRTAFEVTCTSLVNESHCCVEAILSTIDNALVRYTLDGSEPTEKSPEYTGPIEIRTGCTIKARSFGPKSPDRVFSFVIHDNKALGRPVTLLSQPQPHYKFGAPLSLVDGIYGSNNFSDGLWSAWYGNPAVMTIEMDGKTSYSRISVGSLVMKGSTIFHPSAMTVELSEDNVTFSEVASVAFPVENQGDKDDRKVYSLSFPTTSARYVRLTVNPVQQMPQWHNAKGNNAFLFIDEVVID